MLDRRDLVDRGEVLRELELVERGDVRLELLHARGPDQRGGDPLVTQDPGERELRQRLAAALGNLVQRANLAERALSSRSRESESFRLARESSGTPLR